MKNIKKFLTVFAIAIAFNGYGQINFSDTIKIKEVVISAERIRQYAIGNKIESIDSLVLKQSIANSLSEILSSQAQIQINSYGKGAQSSASFRGTGSAHTAVLWNGFNLQDVLNGSVDFSQIPGIFMDDISIQYGGCSALYGSGAIGGVINLDNKLLFDQGLSASVTTSFGSYLNYFQGVEFRISNSKYSGKVRYFYNPSENDFMYSLNGEPEHELLNAQTVQLGTLLSNSFKIGKKQSLTFHNWLQNNKNNLPFDMFLMPGKAEEENTAVRNTAEWNWTGTKTAYIIRTGYFRNSKLYNDPSAQISTNYESRSLISEFENNVRLNSNFQVNSGLNYTHEKGESPNLDNTHLRDRSAIFTSVKYSTVNDAFKLVLSIRDEMINQEITPLTYSAGFDARLFSGFSLKGNVNKSYRIPSFNDLYWNDMMYSMFGNPDLKNEEGLNEEIGLNYKSPVKKVSFELGVTGYNSNVENWIIWQPINNFTIWTPMNVNTVWSRGIEYNANVFFKTRTVFVKLSGMFSMGSATDESEFADESVKGKQLIYVPKYKTVGNLYLEYKGYSLNYSHVTIAKRYTTGDNLMFQNGYDLGNIVISKEFNFEKCLLNVNLQLQNAWDKNYQVMQFYPMPPRNYQLGVKVGFNK